MGSVSAARCTEGGRTDGVVNPSSARSGPVLPPHSSGVMFAWPPPSGRTILHRRWRNQATCPLRNPVAMKAFWVGNRWRVGNIDDAQTGVPVGDVEQGLAGVGGVEDVVVIEQRTAARGFWFWRIPAPSDDFSAGVLVLVVDVRAP